MDEYGKENSDLTCLLCIVFFIRLHISMFRNKMYYSIIDLVQKRPHFQRYIYNVYKGETWHEWLTDSTLS